MGVPGVLHAYLYNNFFFLTPYLAFFRGALKTVCSALPSCEDQAEMLFTMVDGDRLRDISDLPFDLAV